MGFNKKSIFLKGKAHKVDKNEFYTKRYFKELGYTGSSGFVFKNANETTRSFLKFLKRLGLR